MSTTTTIVHRVVAVKIERIEFDGFYSLQFKLTTADGSTVSVDALSAEPLALVDTEQRRVTKAVEA